jgi:C-3',4' desaturase CrtD
VKRVIVIGAGIGGLTAAAALAKAGADVTVLEAHIYPGGSAGTYYHKGYRFDAGATLPAGFYPGGPMELVGGAVGISDWPVQHDDLAMVVHLPNGTAIPRWTDERRYETHRVCFGPESEHFWRWQESTADVMWDFALRLPPWPPQTASDVHILTQTGLTWGVEHLRTMASSLPGLGLDALRPAAVHLRHMPERLRMFVDAQLLISAQATSAHANALYAASALDLPRRGVVHVEGGIGKIAETLAEAVRRHGGGVCYRSEVAHVTRDAHSYRVHLKRGDPHAADVLIFNLPPWNVAALLDSPPPPLKHLPPCPDRGAGAFMIYVGLDGAAVPEDFPLHHQVIVREPLGEGNSIFLSINPSWDRSRAPAGHRAITMSTHTELEPWWRLYAEDRDAYEARKDQYVEKMLAAAEMILPGIHGATRLILPGTPVTFSRFTRRFMGWVGGYPQTNLFASRGPHLAGNLWMVGDSIFPGQSIPAVALGSLRVARAVLQS